MNRHPAPFQLGVVPENTHTQVTQVVPRWRVSGAWRVTGWGVEGSGWGVEGSGWGVEGGRGEGTHSLLRVFMFQSCRVPSVEPTASWLVRGRYCRADTPGPDELSCTHRCLPCLASISLSRGTSEGDRVTTSRSGGRRRGEGPT